MANIKLALPFRSGVIKITKHGYFWGANDESAHGMWAICSTLVLVAFSFIVIINLQKLDGLLLKKNIFFFWKKML